jgi:vancomycin resistance protein YoaR
MIKRTEYLPLFRSVLVPTIAVVAALVLLPLAVFLTISAIYRGRILPGVRVDTVVLGGLTKAQAIAMVKETLRETPPQQTLLVSGQEFRWSNPELGLSYSPESTVEAAYAAGRSGSLTDRLSARWQILTRGTQIPLSWSWNTLVVKAKLETLSTAIDIQTEDPAVVFADGQVTVNPGRDSVIPDTDQTEALLASHVAHPFSDQGQIVVPLKQTSIALGPGEIEILTKRSQMLVGKSLTMTAGENNQTWTLSDAEILGLLSTAKSDIASPLTIADPEKIASYTASIAQTVNHPPENAAFSFDNQSKRVTVFRPAKDGLTLNEDQSKVLIAVAINQLASDKSMSKSIDLPATAALPEITTASVNDLGIRELIGEGSSLYHNSIPGRIHNIELAASHINGTLVPPGDTFSFNKTVGEITAATGYQPAYIIQNGRTVLGDGGGVCQVSTTLFRAILNAGLPIEERWAHAYRVHYYEDGSQLGLDATVFAPSVDFKFRNDTPGSVLIQMALDKTAEKLTFFIYGTSDGRTVAISKSRVWDVTPPPPDLFQDDPTLSLGVTKQVDFAAWGSKAAFDWVVTRNGETLQKKTFYSAYRPWQAVFLKGTKT